MSTAVQSESATLGGGEICMVVGGFGCGFTTGQRWCYICEEESGYAFDSDLGTEAVRPYMILSLQQLAGTVYYTSLCSVALQWWAVY